MLIVTLVVEELFIVKSRVTVLSQPYSFVVVKVYIPLEVYVTPLSTNESQEINVAVFVELLLIVKSRVTVLSQPLFPV